MDNLPRSVRDLIEAIGYGPAIALVNACGGRVIKVPTSARSDGAMRALLLEVLGEDATARLIAVYRGETIHIARCVAAMRDARDQRIIADYAEGTPVATLARRERLTERQIWTIMKRVPGEAVSGLASHAVQMELFSVGG